MTLLNIPRSYTRDELQKEVDDLGFAGRYNFLHLPTEACLSGNGGHAFINLIRPEDAVRFRFLLTGYTFKGGRGRKTASVALAKIQGLQENLRVHKTGPSKRCLPTVLEGLYKSEYDDEDDDETHTRPSSGSGTPTTMAMTPVVSHGDISPDYNADPVRLPPPGLEAVGGWDDPFLGLHDSPCYALHALLGCRLQGIGAKIEDPPWSPPPAPSVDDLLSLKTQLAAKLRGASKQGQNSVAFAPFNDFEPAYVTCPSMTPSRA